MGRAVGLPICAVALPLFLASEDMLAQAPSFFLSPGGASSGDQAWQAAVGNQFDWPLSTAG